MKKYITSSTDVHGTTFYVTTANEIADILQADDGDPFQIAVLRKNGLEAIDLEQIPGSQIIEDNLYLCVSDLEDITVNGNKIDPEDALSKLTPDDLADFIKPITADLVKKRITLYEMKPNVDFDALALKLIKEYSFYELIDSYNDWMSTHRNEY